MAEYGSKEYDKLSPAAELIACILTDGTRIRHPRLAALPPIAFGSDAEFFQTILEVAATGAEPNPRNVATAQRYKGWPLNCGGLPRLERLAMPLPWEQSFEDTLQLVITEYERDEMQRRINKMSGQLQSGEPLEKIRQSAQADIIDFTVGQPEYESTASLSSRAYQSRLKPRKGIYHGFPGLSKLRPMFDFGQMWTLGAFPKSGKSTIVRQMALEVAVKQKRPTVLASLENTNLPTMSYLQSAYSGVSPNRHFPDITNQEKEDLYEASVAIGQSPLLVVQERNIYEIIARVREFGAEFVIVDQLSHLSGITQGKNENRTYLYEKYCDVLREQTCRRLNCNTGLVFQLNRSANTRRPTQFDAKDSSAMAEYSDQMIIPWHDKANDKSLIILELDRYGSPGEAEVVFKPHSGLFDERMA